MRRNSGNLIGLIIVFIFGGIVMLFMGISDAMFRAKKPVDLYDISLDTVEAGMHIDMDIQYMWDAMYSETTETKNYGVTTSTRESARGYLAMFFAMDDSNIWIDKFIGLKASKKDDYATIERMIKESDDWLNDDDAFFPGEYMKTTYHVEGKLKKMTDEELGFACKALGISKSEADEYILPYMIVPVSAAGPMVPIIVGVVLCGLAVLFIFLQIKAKKKAEAANEQFFNANGMQAGAYNPYAADPNAQQGYNINGENQNM